MSPQHPWKKAAFNPTCTWITEWSCDLKRRAQEVLSILPWLQSLRPYGLRPEHQWPVKRDLQCQWWYVKSSIHSSWSRHLIIYSIVCITPSSWNQANNAMGTKGSLHNLLTDKLKVWSGEFTWCDYAHSLVGRETCDSLCDDFFQVRTAVCHRCRLASL